jgi:hypothetical protein
VGVVTRGLTVAISCQDVRISDAREGWWKRAELDVEIGQSGRLWVRVIVRHARDLFRIR